MHCGPRLTSVSRGLQNDLAEIYSARNHIYGENFNLKLWTCAQSMALGARTKLQLEILIRNAIYAIHKFQENILESSRNVSETPPAGPFETPGIMMLLGGPVCIIKCYGIWCEHIYFNGKTVKNFIDLSRLLISNVQPAGTMDMG